MKTQVLLVAVCISILAGLLVMGCVEKSFTPEKEWIVIDVRTPEEFSLGHLKGAANIPYETVADKIGGSVPSKDSPVLLYCRSGRRSGIAYDTLKGLGYTGITNAGAFDKLKKRFGVE